MIYVFFSEQILFGLDGRLVGPQNGTRRSSEEKNLPAWNRIPVVQPVILQMFRLHLCKTVNISAFGGRVCYMGVSDRIIEDIYSLVFEKKKESAAL
jgi:hypothetical protein